MGLLAVIGGLFLCAALAVREFQLSRERASMTAAFEQLKASLETTRAQQRRGLEDVYVLQATLLERHVVDQTELAESRSRLIDGPRKMAQERRAILKHTTVSPTQLILDESKSVH